MSFNALIELQHPSKYRCQFCSKWYATNGQLRRHLNNVHECCEAGRKAAIFDEKQRDARHAAQTECFKCGKTRELGDLTEENREQGETSTSHGNYQCDECGKKFLTAERLQRHLKNIHDSDAFVCEVCDRKYSTRDKLAKHLKSHYGENPATCNICAKQFDDAAAFRKHMKGHVVKKPFPADVRNRKFTEQGHLREHFHTGHDGCPPQLCCQTKPERGCRHNKTAPRVPGKEYKCSACDKDFV